MPELPAAIGPYRPLELIGSGGMGRVYLALDAAGHRVAVKELYPSVAADEAARVRLAREVATMRRVPGRRVAQVVDADVDAPSPYVVTHYIEGRSLLEAAPLTGAELHRVASGLARALADVHSVGCVHRDLKPGNVLLVGDDPVVIDFGIAHEIGATRLTVRGAMGTPGYMAPEVVDGRPIGAAADVFAWGCTVAFAATGRLAHAGASAEELALRAGRGAHDLSGVDETLRPLLADALAPDPALRPSAAELVRRLSPAEPATASRFEPGHDGLRLAGYQPIVTLPTFGPGPRRVRARETATGFIREVRYLEAPLEDYRRVLFRAEARLMDQTAGPFLQQLHEYVDEEACAAFVLSDLRGDSLIDVIQDRGPQRPADAVALLRGSLLALAAVHRAGVVLRDYSPDTVLICADGESRLTGLPMAVPAGTPAAGNGFLYVPPEQWDRAPATPASDVYAACCTLFELLTLQPPFYAPTPEGLERKHRDSPPPLELVVEEMRPLLARGLAKDPAERPADATVLISELETSFPSG